MMMKRTGSRVFYCMEYTEYLVLQNSANCFLNRTKARGKGAPKKKRTAEGADFSLIVWLNIKALMITKLESKKFGKGKKKPAVPASTT